MDDSVNNPSEAKMKILEAMSLIYEVCLKKEEYEIKPSSDTFMQLLKSYNNLQLLRDDSAFLSIESDLNDKFIENLRYNRIIELSKPPFNCTKQSWMK